MKQTTYLNRSLDSYGDRAEFDAEAKKITADKGVLARILQSNVVELKDYDLQEIETFIEGTEISKVPLIPGSKTEAITGMNTEDSVPGEGKITYDVRFYVCIPGKERIRILLNVEIQKDFYPGYDLVPRGIFYCCRMISAQMDTEFTGEDYDKIKKVYSIWLCLNAPLIEADTITSYRITPENIVGAVDSKRHRYDLLNVTMIGLNEDSYQKRATDLHGYLGTIFSPKLSSDDKVKMLEQDYGVKPTKEVKEGLQKMRGLADWYEARGIEHTTKDLLVRLLGRLGQIPEDLQYKIDAQNDIAVLKNWFQIGLEVTSIKEFLEKIS
ncbi:MAG: hypothetical protein IJ716_02960 [Lachnospiraceae bacterium]|nr:hypothetical protein [Lachnospiraceae bacterium]MBR1854254.1 hypothetical protein [Lachnospiraceae bacterium]